MGGHADGGIGALQALLPAGPQNLDDRFDDLWQGDGFQGVVAHLGAHGLPQAFYQFGGALPGGVDEFGLVLHVGIPAEQLQGLGGQLDAAEDVVQVVADTRGDLALGAQAFQVHQFALQPLAHGDVVHLVDEVERFTRLGAHDRGAQQAPHGPAVPGDIPLFELEGIHFSVEQAQGAGAVGFQVVRVEELLYFAAQQFLLGVAQQGAEGGVHLQQAAVHGDDGHAGRGVLEEFLETLLALAQLLFDLAALGDLLFQFQVALFQIAQILHPLGAVGKDVGDTVQKIDVRFRESVREGVAEGDGARGKRHIHDAAQFQLGVVSALGVRIVRPEIRAIGRLSRGHHVPQRAAERSFGHPVKSPHRIITPVPVHGARVQIGKQHAGPGEEDAHLLQLIHDRVEHHFPVVDLLHVAHFGAQAQKRAVLGLPGVCRVVHDPPLAWGRLHASLEMRN